ncbi:MAG: hypothetical protein QOE41_4703 [Mycobacterium sp.]|jgi:uncharacterized protein YjbJ (UPF0337 family)|nr:CsbD family protein [Mycobacterium sp.]MDT5135392.1 hypothetical protein [Mycobacterium sp.]
MSGSDKARNKAQQIRGRAKETIGRLTGDRNLEGQGSTDRVKANLKDAGEKVKDAFRGRGNRRP